MRELVAEEIMSVVGAGSAGCETISGRLVCYFDEAEGTFDDMWMYGSDGSWVHVQYGQVVGQGADM
jgi:hypothetical protein